MADGRIPGAIAVDEKTIEIRIPDDEHRPRGDPLLRVSERGVGRQDREAAEGARLHARAAAAGGIEAWAKAGHAIERGEALPDDESRITFVS